MKSNLYLVLAILLGYTQTSLSQSSNSYNEELQSHFEEYSVHTTDVTKAFNQLKNIHQFQEFELSNTEGGTWVFDLFPSNILSENFVFTKLENGKKIHETDIEVYPYKGFIKGDPYSRVSLTIANGFLQGTVLQNGKNYSFQNLNKYVKSADASKILVYENEHVKDEQERTCELFGKKDLTEIVDSQNKSNAACLGLQLAFANDFLMYQSYDTGVLAHNIAIMNDAQTNYDSDFNDEIEFTLGQIYVAVTAADDPWTSSTDLEDFLLDFTGWGNNGGFDVIYDLATIWTERDFDGPPVGGAWLNGVCSVQRYNAIQDYTANSNSMRVVLAHEMGHNFDANHDAGGSGFIMAPAVNNTNTWSPASLTKINNTIAGAGCLGGCQGFFSAPTAEFSHDLTTSCSPVTVNFFDESNGDIVSWIWLFPGGQPEYSTEQNPSVFYDTDGVYDVTLAVATDGGADEVTAFSEIVLTSVQTVDFSSSVTGNLATFTNNSVPLSATFEWDFGDGSTSSAINPVHSYANDGFYEVTLTIISGCGNISTSEWIEIATLPTADFFTNFTFGCQPYSVEFLDNSSSNVDSYFWEFEGGTPATSTDADPVVVYNDAGTYDVSLTVTNSIGSDQFELFDYITVDPLPVAGFNHTVDMFDVEFFDVSTDATSVLWDFGDGASASIPNPVHTYAMNGSYTVEQTVTNNCGTATISETITINTGPSSVINYDSNTGCTSFTVNFDGSASSSATSYDWSFEGGMPASSSAVNPVVEYLTAGIYDVSLIVSDGVNNDTLEMLDLITVNSTPSSVATTSIDTMTVYGIANADGTMNTSYSWDFGDGTTGTGDTVLHTYAQEGIYLLILSSENECGITHDTSELNLYTVPTAAFTNSNVEGCAPLTVNYMDNSTIAVTEWQWTFPGGTPSSSNLQNPTVIYENAGSYDVALMVSNPSGSDMTTETSLVVVNDVPDVDFLAVNNLTTVTFTNQSVNATSFAWDFGDGNTSILENPTHTYAAEGTFTVSLTATNLCGSVSIEKEIEVNQLPSAGFLTDIDEGCIPFDVVFSNASSSNVTGWSWSFEGGSPASSTDPSPTVSYTSAGSFDVQLIVDSPAGKDTLDMSELIFADDIPSVAFSIEEITEFEFAFTNASSNATSVLWEFGDGNSSIETDPTHIYAEPGEYIVRLTATNACGSITTEETIIIVESAVYDIKSLRDIRILPNPNDGKFQIVLDLSQSETMQVQLINLLGQSVLEENMNLNAGENTLWINADHLSDGTYILILYSANKRATKKLIINRNS